MMKQNINVTKSGKNILKDLKIVTLNQVWLLYQVLLNRVKSTLQKHTKIWDHRNLDVKSEMSLNQMTKRQQSTLYIYIFFFVHFFPSVSWSIHHKVVFWLFLLLPTRQTIAAMYTALSIFFLPFFLPPKPCEMPHVLRSSGATRYSTICMPACLSVYLSILSVSPSVSLQTNLGSKA